MKKKSCKSLAEMSLTWKWKHRSAVGRSSSPWCHLDRGGQRTGLQSFISFSRSSRGALQQERVQSVCVLSDGKVRTFGGL